MNWKKSLTYLATPLICLNFLSCALLDEDPVPSSKEHADVFAAEPDKVWKAIQLAMAAYPIHKNDMDAGLLETKLMIPEKIWQSPVKPSSKVLSSKYKITVMTLPGKLKGEPAIRVIVKKELRYKTNIIDAVKIIPSDGLEEEVILYRIKREISF